MGKAIVKTVSTPMGGTTGVTTTVATTGATGNSVQGITTPAGQVVTGTLDDNGTIINFAQSLGAEIGIQVGSKVNYTTVTVNGQPFANVVSLVHRGEITAVNSTNDGGTLTDKASNLPMPFQQQYASQSGLAVGTKVNFERVVDSSTGAFTAVVLEVVGN
jgi:hypothetical protein